MFCMNCGKKIDDDARFCPNCGTEFADSEDSDDTEDSPSDEPFYKRDLTAGVSNKLWYKLLYAAVVIIAVGGGVYFKLRMRSNGNDETGDDVDQTLTETRVVHEMPQSISREKVSDSVRAQNQPKADAVTSQSDMERGEETKSANTDDLWRLYKVFLDANYTSLKRDAEWEKFAGKQMTCSGRFQDAGKALLGGVYVTVIVDGKWVKLMIDPSQKDKAMSLQKGDRITVTGRVSSRGDLLHVITLENGKIN
ncbi:MAG: zinc ribbon domain-containing protein [Victivallales bacterium]|nr:zinc ribbon domain-containing protein [Victivallales bacterium]